MVDSNIAADACVRKHLNELEQIHRHLQVVHSGIQISVGALRHQNCEVDEDIACMLSHCIGERLLIQIDRLAEVVAEIDGESGELLKTEGDDDPEACKH